MKYILVLFYFCISLCHSTSWATDGALRQIFIVVESDQLQLQAVPVFENYGVPNESIPLAMTSPYLVPVYGAGHKGEATQNINAMTCVKISIENMDAIMEFKDEFVKSVQVDFSGCSLPKTGKKTRFEKLTLKAIQKTFEIKKNQIHILK